MSFSENVGVRFVEAMSGKVGGNGLASDAGDFTYDLQIIIPSLRKFLGAAVHSADIAGGFITWTPFLQGRVPVQPGRVVLYRPEDATRKRKFFDFEFAFDSGAGFPMRVEGHKHLFNDTGFDAASDLSTVFLTLHGPTGPTARGVVSVHINEALRQLRSLQVTGATTPAEEEEAKEAFFAFMNRELREVYPNMPLIIREVGKFTLEERRTLTMCVRIMLPDPLPPDGAQTGDIIDYLEDFITSSPSPDLQNYRNMLHAAGLVLPVLGNDVDEVRKFAADQLKSRTRTPVRDVLSFVHTLVTLPYYAHPKTDASVQYTRPKHEPHAVPLKLPVVDDPPNDLFDVVIAGSGPAGSLLAERLSAAGKKVLVLEAGPYVPEHEVTPDEMFSLATLYKAGGLQRANEQMSIFDSPGPTFFVLQGGCLGGGGVVNNTVCFQLSAERITRWQDAGFPITEATLRKAYGKIAAELPILPISKTTKVANKAGNYLTDAFGPPKVPPVDQPPAPGFYECLVNLEPLDAHGNGCLGKGVCNVGCGSERKRNALQVHLRSAVQKGCVVVHSARVRDVIFDKATHTVSALGVELRSGYRQIRGREFVLASGPIGSTEILLRSAALQEHIDKNNLPVGKRFSANVGSPVWAFTKDDAQNPPGLQIAHYYYPPDQAPFVFETWYNPPGANAVAMPGYMSEHFDRMKKYMRTVAAAPLVGSQPSGKIKLRDNKIFVRLPVGAQEVEGFATGLSVLAGAFAKSSQVDHALVGFGASGREIRTEQDALKLRDQLLKLKKEPEHLHLLKMGTGHPQGGNAMSSSELGVVRADFRVRGIDNLRICDASVFPDSAAVNPQWTVMALAEICANSMLGTPTV